MPFITEKDVLDCLSHVEWKRGLQILDEIAAKWGVSKFSFRGPSLALYVTLRNLEEDGWIEHREAELTQEERESGDDGPAREYRLTEGGVRERYERDQKITVGIPDLLGEKT
jgi:DNA-binding PadR family transcriptional regulator